MKKGIVLLVAGVVSLALAIVSFSEEQAGEESQKATMGAGPMHKGMMMQQGQKEGMHPMQGMMMKSMMEKTIVATEDGGVVVLVGNKLLKYDKNLNLQKEVEIKIDTSAMEEKMMQMKEKHRKRSEMMQQENKQEAPVEAQRR